MNEKIEKARTDLHRLATLAGESHDLLIERTQGGFDKDSLWNLGSAFRKAQAGAHEALDRLIEAHEEFARENRTAQ